MLTEDLIDKKLEYYSNRRGHYKVNIQTLVKHLKEIKEVHKKHSNRDEKIYYNLRDKLEKIEIAFQLLSLEYCKEKFSNK